MINIIQDVQRIKSMGAMIHVQFTQPFNSRADARQSCTSHYKHHEVSASSVT